MALILELKSGPFVGQKIPVSGGQTFLVGRAADRAHFAVPHDKLMSGVHFAVDCGPDGCRVIDKKSTNGTYLNGASIREPMLLADGDEIKSGQTVFIVHITPDNLLLGLPSNPHAAAQSPASLPPAAPAPASKAPNQVPATAHSAASSVPAVRTSDSGQTPVLAIGSWVFHEIPERWHIQEGLGIQQDVRDAFPATIGATQEPVGPGITLTKYVDEQTKMLRESLHLYEPKLQTVAAPAVSGSDEIAALEIHFRIKDGPSVCMYRLYARSGLIIGVLTLTSLEKDFAAVKPIYDSTISGISYARAE